MTILTLRVGGDRVIAHRAPRWEESPDSEGGALGNSQAERSDTGTTENRPPMAEATWTPIWVAFGSGKGETAG